MIRLLDESINKDSLMLKLSLLMQGLCIDTKS